MEQLQLEFGEALFPLLHQSGTLWHFVKNSDKQTQKVLMASDWKQAALPFKDADINASLGNMFCKRFRCAEDGLVELGPLLRMFADPGENIVFGYLTRTNDYQFVVLEGQWSKGRICNLQKK